MKVLGWGRRLIPLAMTLLVGTGCHHTPGQTAQEPAPTSFDQAIQARMGTAATTSPVVVGLTGAHPLSVVSVVPSNIGAEYRFAQVTVHLVDGSAVLTGGWPHAVIDNPARCDTCKPDGPLRWHYETDQVTRTVSDLL